MVELVTVIVIIGVLAAIATPRYASALSRYRSQSAAQRIALDLQLVRERAKATGRQGSIRFNASTDSYTLTLPNSDGTAETQVVSLAADPYSTDIVSLTPNGTTTVNISGFGIADAQLRVVLASATSTWSVTIHTGAGRATCESVH